MAATIFFSDFNQEPIDQAWEQIIASKDAEQFNPDLKAALDRGDKLKAMALLFAMDKDVVQKFSRKSFSAPLKLDQEALVEKMFVKATGIKLEEQDFYPGEAIAGVPLELWSELFRKLPPQVVDQMRKECQKKNFPYDMFRGYLMGVKDVVKFCLENNARLVGYYSSAPGAFMRGREEAILTRLGIKELHLD